MTAWQLKDLASHENAIEEFKGTDVYVKMMLIFPTLLSAIGQPGFQSPWANPRQNVKKAKSVF